MEKSGYHAISDEYYHQEHGNYSRESKVKARDKKQNTMTDLNNAFDGLIRDWKELKKKN